MVSEATKPDSFKKEIGGVAQILGLAFGAVFTRTPVAKLGVS